MEMGCRVQAGPAMVSTPRARGASMPSPGAQDWAEWRRRCAADRCSAQTAAALRRYLWPRFRSLLSRYGAGAGSGLTAVDGWHLFEVHLAVDRTRAGKRYKQWLFAYVRTARDGAEAALSRGVVLLLRDVVRTFIAREGPRPKTVSLSVMEDALFAGDGLAGELLPDEGDPADAAAAREFERLAESEAQRFWSGLTSRERIVFSAVEEGVALSHPSIARRAGCAKSMLYACHRDAVRRVAGRLLLDYEGEDRSAVLILTRLTLRRLCERALRFKLSESGVGTSFSSGESRVAAHGSTASV